jgi:hypothetical protein
MFAKPIQTYVDGDLYFDIELDAERRAAIQAEKQALMEKHGVGQAGGRVAADRVAQPRRQRQEVRR